jgi:hypothetical protein
MTMTFPPTRVTKDTGATIKPGPMVTAAPELVLTDADFAGVAEGTGLNGPFLADFLASAATHENDGVNLFRALGHMTQNPVLQAQYRQFRQDCVTAVETYETLIAALGSRPKYVSPPGRMTEAMDQKMLEAFQAAGSADPLTLELKGVEATLLASTLCIANTSVLARIGEGLDEGAARTAIETAVAALSGPQQAHLEWAAQMQQTMLLTQVRSRLVQQVGSVVETVAGKIKDVLSP